MPTPISRALSVSVALSMCASLGAQSVRVPGRESSPAEDLESAIFERIRGAEYHFSSLDAESGVWSAPNRGQGLRSRISAHGLEVFARTTGADGVGAPWKLTLATTSFGRASGAFELPRALVSVTGERVELDHGYLLEWFVNDERGIQQGWTIPERLIGSEVLSIGLSISGELSLRVEEGGRSGMLVDGCGEAVLRYRDLRAFDASGRELEARLVPTRAGVAVEVNDARAVYPLTVDPLLTDPAWTAESNQEGAYFGGMVSTAGDVNGDRYSDVIVLALGYDNGLGGEGRVFVFHGASGGLGASPAWTTHMEQDFGFGFVATAGDVNRDGYSDVVIGEPGYSNGQYHEGRVQLYQGSAAGLSATPAWGIESDQEDALLGFSGATAGDVNGDGYSDVIVTEPTYPVSKERYGRARVYHGSSAGLATEADWIGAFDLGWSAPLGYSVSTAGDVNGDGYSDVIIGGVDYAVVVHGSTTGLAAFPAVLLLEDDFAKVPSWFGMSVSTAGDVNGDGYSDVIVGAQEWDEDDSGRVFVYHGSATGIDAVSDWSVGSSHFEAFFGVSVATAGDVNGDGYSDVLVGASQDDGQEVDAGRAFAYHGSPSGLATSPAWNVDANQSSAFLGHSVSMAGDVNGDGYVDVIVGAPGFDNGEIDEGRAFVYHGSAGGLAAAPAWTVEPNEGEAYFGGSVSAGDVNGDGFSDVIVGAPLYGGEGIYRGAAFVFHGSANTLGAIPAWVLESDQNNAQLGDSVSTAGDVNGDGYCDVIVGTPGHDGDLPNEGRVQVYHGSASGLSSSPAWVVESQQADAWFGDSVSTAGDVNGDGYSDVIVGASSYDGGDANEGRAYVYLGSASGLATSPAWLAEGDQTGASFGYAVATAGDVNADGYSDVIVGARDFDGGQVDEGRAFVFLGGATGVAASPVWTAGPDQAAAHFGESVSTAGDVNGDGFSDVIVGAYAYDDEEIDEGRAFVFLGTSSGLGASAAWTAESDEANAYFGHSVSTAGDVNADGYSEVIVGAIWYDGGEINEGRAYVYHGSATGLAPSPAWTAEANQGVALLGAAVSAAGDVNGDGYGEVIVGVPLYDDGQFNEGGAWVYFGNHSGWPTGPGLGVEGGPSGGSILVRALQQRTRNGARPLSIGGDIGTSGFFRIRCEFSTNTAGWSWSAPLPTARLEWEVKPLGVAFDGTAIQSSASQSLSTPGVVTFDELVSVDDLQSVITTEAQSYHWRARVATNSPVFPNTAWFSAPGSSLTEAKVRRPARKDFRTR